MEIVNVKGAERPKAEFNYIGSLNKLIDKLVSDKNSFEGKMLQIQGLITNLEATLAQHRDALVEFRGRHAQVDQDIKSIAVELKVAKETLVLKGG